MNDQREHTAVSHYRSGEKAEMDKQPNPTCKECKGTGTIRFFFDQDITRDCKCPECFPHEKKKYDVLMKQWRK